MHNKLLFACKNTNKLAPKTFITKKNDNFMLVLQMSYLKGSNFHGQKFSRNKFSRLAGPKTVSFAELIFAIGLFIVNFAEFIFTMDRSKRSQRG